MYNDYQVSKIVNQMSFLSTVCHWSVEGHSTAPTFSTQDLWITHNCIISWTEMVWGWLIKLFLSNKKINLIPLGKLNTSFGKLLKYACLMASVADILFLGMHYRTSIAT